MKTSLGWLTAFAIIVGGCASPRYALKTTINMETVRSREESFRRNVEVEIAPCDKLNISEVRLKHQRKKEKGSAVDYLIVEGYFKDVRARELKPGFTLRIQWFAADGLQIGEETRTVNVRRRRKGNSLFLDPPYFSIKTKRGPEVARCRISVES